MKWATVLRKSTVPLGRQMLRSPITTTSALRPSVLGGVDGVVTSFAIVAGASAGALSSRTVVIVGTSSLLADGVSMGVSEYLSSSAHTPDAPSPVYLGVVCFLSFVLCGAVPITAYLAAQNSLVASAASAFAALITLGAARARVAGGDILLGVVQTAILGGAAGLVAYAVGMLAANFA